MQQLFTQIIKCKTPMFLSANASGNKMRIKDAFDVSLVRGPSIYLRELSIRGQQLFRRQFYMDTPQENAVGLSKVQNLTTRQVS
jgi:hypothetical protein